LLLSSTDTHHERAKAFRQQLETSRTTIVTTRAVLWEIGNGLARHASREKAIGFLTRIEADPQCQIIPVSPMSYEQALALYRSRPDKEWGLIDCWSFLVMDELGIRDALTADRHFGEAGYRALLRADN
jgi:predicted nucleic acid-binding protein